MGYVSEGASLLPSRDENEGREVETRKYIIPYCQNKFVSSSRSARTPQPGLLLETVQLAKFPISFSPRAAGSNNGVLSMVAR